MALTLFDQFNSPTLHGIPLIVLAFALPWAFFPSSSVRPLKDRLLTLLDWFIQAFTKQLLAPMSALGHKWALLLTALMLNILALNVLGLLPYTFTPTTQLSLNLAFAFPLWLATVLLGLRNQPTHALGHLLPEGTPTLLIPVLIIIETISLLIRPLALGVRLTANLTAGHLLIQLTSMATFTMLFTAPPVAFMTVALLALLSVLEIAVAMIQAYVFILLLSLYLQENT